MNSIGIFDSGVGGLGIFQEIKKLMPNENIIYLADSKNCPYGEKSVEQIKQIALNNTRFLIEKGAKIVVIACNTASTIALQYVRNKLNLKQPRRLNKVGDVIPIIGVVPVVKTASEITKNKRIGILATKRTIESKYLQDLVNRFCPSKDGLKVYYQGANELIEFVENLELSHPECSEGSNYNKIRFFVDTQNDIKKYLSKFIKNKVDVVVLGCTHFPFLRYEIEEILGPNVKLLDSNGAVARQTSRLLTINKQLSTDNNGSHYEFYTSGDKSKLKYQLKNLIGIETDNILTS